MIIQSIDFEVEYGADYNPDFEYADGWTCTFSYQGRDIETPFYMGKGHFGAEPNKEEVLDCLFMDAYALDTSFEEWCREFGYDSDSIKALKTYEACVKNGNNLVYLLGSDFEAVRDEIQELQL